MVYVHAELAKPETAGGVVVILERPSRQRRSGMVAVTTQPCQRQNTLKEVARLVLFATDGTLTIEDVTVLDAFPRQPDDDPALYGIKKSSNLLRRLLSG